MKQAFRTVYIIIIIYTVLITAFALSANAQNTQPYFLSHLIMELREYNPELKAARYQWKSAQSLISAASALPDPQMMSGLRNVGFDSFSLGKEMMSNLSLMATQKIPFPTKLQVKDTLAREKVKQTQYKYYAKEQGLITTVKNLYLNLYFNHQATTVIEHIQALLKKFKKTAEVKYSVGKVPQQDIFKAQVEISRLSTRIIQLAASREQLLIKVESMIGKPLKSRLFISDLSELNHSEHVNKNFNALIIKNSPSLLIKKSVIESSRLKTALAYQQFYPDFALSGGYMNRALLDAIWEFKIGVTLPLYTSQKQTPRLEAAQKELLANQSLYQAHYLELEEKLKHAQIQYESEKKLFSIYQSDIIPQSKKAFDASLAGYIGDKVDFLTVLSNLKALLNEELSRYKKEVAFHQALVVIQDVLAHDIYPGGIYEKK